MIERKDVVETAEGRHGVVAQGELLGAGLSRGQVETLVRTGRLVTIGPGAYRIGGAPDTREARVLGAILGIEGDVWASHRTAAWLHGLRVHGPAGLVEVARPHGASANRGAVQIHRSTLVLPHHVVGRAVFGRIPGIEWEVALSDAQGYVRRVDAYVRWARLVIEFDGARFHDQPSDVAADAAGDGRLVALGLTVERCRWIDLTHRSEVVLAKVMRLIHGGAAWARRGSSDSPCSLGHIAQTSQGVGRGQVGTHRGVNWGGR